VQHRLGRLADRQHVDACSCPQARRQVRIAERVPNEATAVCPVDGSADDPPQVVTEI
jgi:hypothetical protein